MPSVPWQSGSGGLICEMIILDRAALRALRSRARSDGENLADSCRSTEALPRDRADMRVVAGDSDPATNTTGRRLLIPQQVPLRGSPAVPCAIAEYCLNVKVEL